MALSIIKHFCNLGIKNNFCVKAIVSFLMLVIVGTYRNLKGLRTNLHSDFLPFVIISAKVHWLEHLICVQLVIAHLLSRSCDRVLVLAHLRSRTCYHALVIAQL